MKKETLSVVVPVYNTAPFLNRCIETLLNQTMIENLRIIIINDCSTDDSEQIIISHMSQSKKITYIPLSSNIGVGNARNIGINNAKTDYIAFLDSDDWVDITYYEKMMNSIKNKETSICISGIKTESDDVYNWKYRYFYPSDFVTDGQFCLHALTNQYNSDIAISPIVNNRVYSRDLLEKNGLTFDRSTRAQDLVFSFLSFVYSDKISFCSDCFYHYYQRESSATHSFSKQYIDDYCYNLQLLKSELKNRNLFNTYRSEYESYVYIYLTKLIRNLFNNINDQSEQKSFMTYILQQMSNFFELDDIISFIEIERIKDFFTR